MEKILHQIISMSINSRKKNVGIRFDQKTPAFAAACKCSAIPHELPTYPPQKPDLILHMIRKSNLRRVIIGKSQLKRPPIFNHFSIKHKKLP